MYPVTPNYLAAIASNPRPDCRIIGTITLYDGVTVVPIDDSKIQQGSLSFAEKCISGSNIDLGSVYASEMSLSLIGYTADPYALDGARIALNFGIDVSGGNYEYVPLGYYYVTDIKRMPRAISLKALDGMILLDKDLTGVLTSGTPRSIIASLCARCGVNLATPAAEFNTYPNASLFVALPEDSKINTCRDLLMWLCQLCGAFGRFNRQGNLETVRLGAESIVRTIMPGERLSTAVSDYYTKVTKVTMSVDTDDYSKGVDGMTLELDENPFLLGKSNAEINAALANILNSVTEAEYAVCSAELFGDPALQAGDTVLLQLNMQGGVNLAHTEHWALDTGVTLNAEVFTSSQAGLVSDGLRGLTQDAAYQYSMSQGDTLTASVQVRTANYTAIDRGVAVAIAVYDTAGSLLHTYNRAASLVHNDTWQTLSMAQQIDVDGAAYAAIQAYVVRNGTVEFKEPYLRFGGSSAYSKSISEIYRNADIYGRVRMLITSSTWRYRGQHTVRADGEAALLRVIESQETKNAIAKTNAAARLARAANQSTVLINSAIGGNVLIRQAPENATNEILIMDSVDPTTAKKLWRWNMGGLGYSDNVVGADNPLREYDVAITMDGGIVADFIQTGFLRSAGGESWLNLDDGSFSFANGAMTFDGTNLDVEANITGGTLNIDTDATVGSKLTLTKTGVLPFSLRVAYEGGYYFEVDNKARISLTDSYGILLSPSGNDASVSFRLVSSTIYVQSSDSMNLQLLGNQDLILSAINRVRIQGDTGITGNIGFFSTSPTFKRSVSTSYATTIAQIVSDHNTLVNALKAYGLV